MNSTKIDDKPRDKAASAGAAVALPNGAAMGIESSRADINVACGAADIGFCIVGVDLAEKPDQTLYINHKLEARQIGNATDIASGFDFITARFMKKV